MHSGEVDKESEMYIETAINPNVKQTRGLSLRKKSSVRSFVLMQQLFCKHGNGSGATIISAASGYDFAFKSDVWRSGVFTYCVLQGLLNGLADANKDGGITVTELQDYVGEQVLLLTPKQQRPTSRQVNYSNDWQGWKN